MDTIIQHKNSSGQQDLIQKVDDAFRSKFSSDPIHIISPGRVNLIGDHTDYNDGFVLPAAIDKAIFMAINTNQSKTVRTYSLDMEEYIEIDLNGDLESQQFQWANYVKGVISELRIKGFTIDGFDLVFGGDIPIGAGLSSSAALEGGILLGLKNLFDLDLSKKEMARIGQLTEHNHVGVRCGIMDQFINIHGEVGQALKLDCRSLDFELVPFDRDDLKIVLFNSKVSHNLASSEYNLRRSQCEEGVELLKKYDPSIKNLRDVSMKALEENKHEMPSVVYQRCKFVIEENERVLNGCKDLGNGDIDSFGKRMFESHEGLSTGYEVSCEELDILIDSAKGLPGLIGARMMGGGFGGCTINLVEEHHIESFTNTVAKEYKQQTGIDCEFYVTKIGPGVHISGVKN